MNNFILQLFDKLINSPERVVSISNGEIKFNNGVALYIYYGTNSKEEEIKPLALDQVVCNHFFAPCSYTWNVDDIKTDEYQFMIQTPIRTYDVPTIKDRVERAELYNRVDAFLADAELNILNNLLHD